MLFKLCDLYPEGFSVQIFDIWLRHHIRRELFDSGCFTWDLIAYSRMAGLDPGYLEIMCAGERKVLSDSEHLNQDYKILEEMELIYVPPSTIERTVVVQEGMLFHEPKKSPKTD